MEKVKLNWKEEMEFGAQGGSEVGLTIDGAKKKGANPPELLLMSVASCTSIHLKLVLDKMRIEFDDLAVEVEGKRAEESPKYFTDIEFEFKVWGDEIEAEKMEKALNLAIDNCGMWQTVGSDTEMTFSYEIK